MQATAQPVQTRVIEPAVVHTIDSQNPTEIRYGWCPYGDINLMNGDGTINLYVQPTEIENGTGGVIPNPYFRMLPKGQLIPFPTFNAEEPSLSPDFIDSNGRAVMTVSRRAISALEAATSVLRGYGSWGFTIIASLQGVDQDTAFRIFTVIQPLEYPIGQIQNELAFGARERIDATEPITFDSLPGYTVEPLRSDYERSLAYKVVSEMEAGAQIAFDLASEQLSETEQSMTQRHSGGMGKSGPDPLDRRLSAELDRELPKLIGTTNRQADLESKIDLLVSHAASQAQKDEIAQLKAELAAAKSGVSATTMQADAPPPVIASICGYVKDNGQPCGASTRNNELCRWHKEATAIAA